MSERASANGGSTGSQAGHVEHATHVEQAEHGAVDESHPLIVALAPLLHRVDGELVAPDRIEPADVPLVWDGQLVAGVRLPPTTVREQGAVGDLGLLLDELARELGGALHALPRAQKQRAVRLLEERGAFSYRKSAETVAEALGVSRFTVYNYLNRNRR